MVIALGEFGVLSLDCCELFAQLRDFDRYHLDHHLADGVGAHFWISPVQRMIMASGVSTSGFTPSVAAMSLIVCGLRGRSPRSSGAKWSR